MKSTQHSNDLRDGVIAAIMAYTMWGFLPAYFKFTDHVGAIEMLAMRVVWSVPFGALIILARRQSREVLHGLLNVKTFLLLVLASLFIAINWFLYIWAVQHNQIFQASLGYYINPLIYVLVGVVFFGDQLRQRQLIAVILAAIAVLSLTILGGEFPVIALALAITFTAYGVLKKQININGMPGLFIETLVLFLPAMWYLMDRVNAGNAAISTDQPGMFVLLMLAGPITVLPLLFFGLAARRLRLSMLGFLQFIGPTIQFILGLVFGEKLSLPYAVCFTLIWIAVLLYAFDAWSRSRVVVPT